MFKESKATHIIRNREDLTAFLNQYLLVRNLERVVTLYDFGTAARVFQIRVDKSDGIEMTFSRSPRILEMITGPKGYSSTSEKV